MRNLLLLVVFFVFPQTIAGQSPCDKELKPIDNPQLKYKNRGNNICEGFYEAKIGGGLHLVGLTRGAMDFSLHPEEKVEITCPNIIDDTIFIKVQPVPLKTYYRMDAQCISGGPLVWPMNEVIMQIKDLAIVPDDLGITGFKYNATADTIYIPVRTKSRLKENITNNDIQILFRSTIDLKNVLYKAKAVGRNFKKKWTLLEFSEFNAGNPIAFKLPFSTPGLYILELAGENKYEKGDWRETEVKILIPNETDY